MVNVFVPVSVSVGTLNLKVRNPVRLLYLKLEAASETVEPPPDKERDKSSTVITPSPSNVTATEVF